jgi:CBS domain containing-hemolysin-like protein
LDSWIIWVGLVALVALTLFSTLNVTLRSPSRARIAEQLKELGGTQALRDFVAHRNQYTLTTAIWRSAAVLALFLSVLMYALGGLPPDSVLRIASACLVAWVLLLIFGVAIPYAWAKYAGEWLTVRCRWLLAGGRIVSYPLLLAIGLFDPLMRRLAGVPVEDAQSYADKIEEEILNAVSEGELHGAVDSEEKQMIESVIEMGEQRVAEIMTPRTDIVAVRVDDARRQFWRSSENTATHASPCMRIRSIRFSGPLRQVYCGTRTNLLGFVR